VAEDIFLAARSTASTSGGIAARRGRLAGMSAIHDRHEENSHPVSGGWHFPG